ncbi:MAG TPA: DUF2269 family protein [Gaiellaceae bacterium]|nr:DUF2269 family protein [Gaiellaceae bacterium]
MDTPSSAASTPGRAGSLPLIMLGVVVAVGAVFVLSGSAFMPNDWYALFKAIHVVIAVVWVGGGLMLTVDGIRARRESNPASVVAVAQRAAFWGEKVFAPAGLVVFLMGVAMMINTNWGWGHFWIVAGLIGYSSTFITGIAVLSPMAKKIDASAQANGPEHPSTVALIERILIVAMIDVSVLALVILDMATKPFA